ncbi:DUF2972 domain-containing protein [Helicobacter apodemus]|uniref:DUF2972 domain-containing protein n=1 Tax=Helicobacter apodemus TaxID=135569 RepID=A0A2U8FC03_9HELI|nr:DUF2972 domain-containing protein [Helicobacter apodemus]AWI33780.1 hypothetical protein CDV25_02640 [Helicobacter apodemus]
MGGGQNNTYLVSLIPFAFLKLLLCLYKIKQTHKKQQQFYKQTIQLFPNLKYPSLQDCKDYQQSLCFQYHLAYLLGEALSKADKIWYKGGYFTLNKKIKEAKHIYKLHQEYKAILKVFNLPYCFIPKESLLQTLSFLKALKHLYNASDSKTTQTFFLHLFNQIPFYTQRPFLLKYKEEILEWLESKEFKEQYIKTNHPYPPLLNPKRLYKKESIEVKSQREDRGRSEDGGELQRRGDREDRETKEGKEVEIQSKETKEKETQSNSKGIKGIKTESKESQDGELQSNTNVFIDSKSKEEIKSKEIKSNKEMGDKESKDNGISGSHTKERIRGESEEVKHKEKLVALTIQSNNEVKSKEIKEDRNRETKEGKEVEIQSKETKEKETQNIKGIIKEISKQQEIQNQKENSEELVEVKTEINKGIGDRDSENVESKNEESLQPYANLSYESIPASLAWDLNLPLVGGYNLIFIGRGVSGHAALWRYLSLCGISVKVIREGDQKAMFLPLYSRDSAENTCIALITWWNHNRLKQASLLDKNVPVIFLVRDPISRLKSAMNHGNGIGNGEFVLGDDLEKVLDRKRYYKNSRTINPESLEHLWRAYDFRDYTNVAWFSGKEIVYVDMQEIMPNRAFETMTRLSKIVGFNPPKPENKHLFEAQSVVFELAHTLPLTLKVKYDCNVICIEITRDIYTNPNKYLLNNELTPHLMLKQISIRLETEHYAILFQNKPLFKEVLEYLDKFVLALWEKKEWIRQMQWNEARVLEYLRDNKPLRNEIYRKLEKELVHIKSHRLDIVKSWKYYQEFVKMCEVLD